MEWYTKYLSIFGLTLSEIPGDTLSEIGTLLHEKPVSYTHLTLPTTPYV